MSKQRRAYSRDVVLQRRGFGVYDGQIGQKPLHVFCYLPVDRVTGDAAEIRPHRQHHDHQREQASATAGHAREGATPSGRVSGLNHCVDLEQHARRSVCDYLAVSHSMCCARENFGHGGERQGGPLLNASRPRESMAAAQHTGRDAMCWHGSISIETNLHNSKSECLFHTGCDTLRRSQALRHRLWTGFRA